MRLKLCPQCKRPFLAREEFCPRCPRLEWNQESWANLGCLAAMIVVPLFVMILFWLFFFMGFFIR